MAKNNRITPKELREKKKNKKSDKDKFDPNKHFTKTGPKEAKASIQKAVESKGNTINLGLSAKNTYDVSPKDLAEMRKKKLNRTTNKSGSGKTTNNSGSGKKPNKEVNKSGDNLPDLGRTDKKAAMLPQLGNDADKIDLTNEFYDPNERSPGQKVEKAKTRLIDRGEGESPLITNLPKDKRGGPQTGLGGAPSKEAAMNYAKMVRNDKIAKRMEAGDYEDMGASQFSQAMQNDPSSLLQNKQSGGSQGSSSAQDRLSKLREKRDDIDISPSGGIHETMDRLAKYKSLNREIGNLQQTQGALREQKAATQGDIRERRLAGEQKMDRAMATQKLRNQAQLAQQKSRNDAALQRKTMQVNSDYLTEMREPELGANDLNKIMGDVQKNLSEDMTTRYTVSGNTVKESSNPDEGVTYGDLPPDKQNQLLEKHVKNRIGVIKRLRSGGNAGGEDPNDRAGLRKTLEKAKG